MDDKANDQYRKLRMAIIYKNEARCLSVLAKIEPCHCYERTNCFFCAVGERMFRVADAILDQGLEFRNVRTGDGRSLIELQRSTDSIDYLLRRGATIPRKVLSMSGHYHNVVADYVYRTWTPRNHTDWPIPFKKAIVTLLLARARTHTAVHYLHMDALFHLIKWIACGQFVFV